MTYVTETTVPDRYRGTRIERTLELKAFAADLAQAIGGKLRVSDMGQWQQFVEIGDLSLSLCSARGGKNDRVSIHASPLSFDYDDRPPYYDGKGKFPQITVAVDRDMAAIARDVKKRVIDMSADPLAYTKRYAGERQASRSHFAETQKRLEEMGFTVRPNGDGTGGQLWRDEPYISGTVYEDGAVTISQLGSIDVGKLPALVALLNKPAA